MENNGLIKCGDCNKFYRCTTCDEPCGSEGHYVEDGTNVIKIMMEMNAAILRLRGVNTLLINGEEWIRKPKE